MFPGLIMAYAWSPASVQEIVHRSGMTMEYLDQECSQEVLLGVAHLCEPWETIGEGLNLSVNELSFIDYNYGNDEEKRVAVLERWKETFDFNATYRKLMEAFVSTGNARGAQEVCRILCSENDHENVLNVEGVIQFGFHPVTGKNITLSEDGLQARRKDLSHGADAVVMGAKPLKGLAKLEVEVLSLDSKPWSAGSLQLGVMQCKSGTQHNQSDIPAHSEFGNNHCILWKSYVWNSLGDRLRTSKYATVDLCDLKEGDRVGMGLTSEGDLLFFLNGKSHGVGAWNVSKKGIDLYPVVDVANTCQAVRITTAGTDTYLLEFLYIILCSLYSYECGKSSRSVYSSNCKLSWIPEKCGTLTNT